MKQIALYQTVRLITDKYLEQGLKKGVEGIVLEKWDDENYEIQWFDDHGNTITFCSFHINDFEPIQTHKKSELP